MAWNKSLPTNQTKVKDELGSQIRANWEALETLLGVTPLATGNPELSNGGWFVAGETWTYASADDPTFTFTISGDKTTKYCPGMRIKLTQTSVKYFIITAVSYSSPNTTVTIYGGRDYDLANATIENPFYSPYKAPFGFPLDPNKWTVEVTDTIQRNQSNPTQNTWYNLGSVNITIPIGQWNVEYSMVAAVSKNSATDVNVQTTLSTANNSESDPDYTTFMGQSGSSASPMGLYIIIFRRKTFSLNSKTTLYINTRTLGESVNTLYNYNNYSKLIIRAICAYL